MPVGSADMKHGRVHSELNSSETHGSLATSGQQSDLEVVPSAQWASERDSSGYKTVWR